MEPSGLGREVTETPDGDAPLRTVAPVAPVGPSAPLSTLGGCPCLRRSGCISWSRQRRHVRVRPTGSLVEEVRGVGSMN